MLKIINGGGVNQVVREAAVWCRVLIEPIGRLNVAKKSRKAKRGALRAREDLNLQPDRYERQEASRFR